jgi:hypothetical protein
MDHINYPNNNTPNNTSKPNYSSQTEFDQAINKGERGYYGNDGKLAHYPNSNRTSDEDKRPPNSNTEQQ